MRNDLRNALTPDEIFRLTRRRCGDYTSPLPQRSARGVSRVTQVRVTTTEIGSRMKTYTEQLDAKGRGDSRRALGAVAPVWSVVGGHGQFGHNLASREMSPKTNRRIADVALHPPR
jgi:hypothetical protein